MSVFTYYLMESAKGGFIDLDDSLVSSLGRLAMLIRALGWSC